MPAWPASFLGTAGRGPAAALAKAPGSWGAGLNLRVHLEPVGPSCSSCCGWLLTALREVTACRCSGIVGCTPFGGALLCASLLRGGELPGWAELCALSCDSGSGAALAGLL